MNEYQSITTGDGRKIIKFIVMPTAYKSHFKHFMSVFEIEILQGDMHTLPDGRIHIEFTTTDKNKLAALAMYESSLTNHALQPINLN